MNAIRVNDTVCLVELPSDLTDPDEKPYTNTCVSQVSARKDYLVLDFSMVTMMNGLGATMLVKFGTLARRRGQFLVAIGVNDHYKNVLKVTGLDQIMRVYSSREEAFAAMHITDSNLPAPSLQKNSAQDLSYWAKPIERLNVLEMPPEAINRNMNDRRVVGPVDGFGQLWQKKYRLNVSKADVTPEDVIKILKENFPRFQPSYNRFYPSENGIQPGEVVAIDSSTPGGPVSTGVMVLYSDETSFTFITPQGHPESGWVTFSAFETNNNVVVQILGLARANDPLYEAAFRTVGSKMQVKIWRHVLTSLATFLGIPADITVEPVRVDSHMQWTQMGNIWFNAQVRTIFYMPFHLIKRASKGQSKKER